MENTQDFDKICQTLDKLTLDNLTLMEEHIELNLNLEESMNDGEMNLVKSRYILGRNNVSSLQLPTEDSHAVDAVAVVHTEKLDKGYLSHDLEIVKKSDDEGAKPQDPLRWFGILVPQNLHLAQSKFRQALVWATQIANVRERLDYNCQKIEQLRDVKSSLVKTL